MPNILRKQVFAHPNEIIVVLFHRASFAFYFLLALFTSFLVATRSIPDMMAGVFSLANIVFFFVFGTSAISAWASSTFPRFGRTELYSSTLLVIFLIVGEVASILFGLWAFSLLSLAFFVIPVSRVLMIYILLIKNAKGAW